MRARGLGRIFPRGAIWHIAYCRNGVEIRESANTTDEVKARKLLNQRIEEAKRPEFVGPAEKRLTLDTLQAKIEADYRRHERRSLDTVKYCLKAVKEHFKYDRLAHITPRRIEEYQTARLAEGMSRATVNREVRYLLHGFKLLFDAHEISTFPRVKLLEGENIREGFVNAADFEAIAVRIEDQDTRDIVEFLYRSAWRSGEAKSLTWDKVDLTDWVIRLSRKNEKTKRPRTLALVGELRAIIERRQQRRFLNCALVFHRAGKAIKRFDRAFKSACKKEGFAELVVHDMRRSAIRNFTKAGLSPSEGMSISGHRTDSIYRRYNIIDEEMQRRSLERVQEHQQQEIETRKVVPLKKQA